MGKLVEGVWHDVWYDTKANGGKFVREDAGFRDWIKNDSEAVFQPESGRYHLYVSLACPWAHRTLIFRKLKGLEPHIDVTVVCPDMLSQGWQMGLPEPLFGHTRMHQIYTQAKPDYTGRVTVPVLWDKKTNTIVSNESSEIIRMFNSAFNDLTGNHDDYYPEPLRGVIDEWNDYIYPNVNNGVYRCGFATSQEAYEEAFESLFSALDKIDAHLATHRYLAGNKITEADWRLFTTLVRFDAVYVGHFKCNKQRIADYVNIQGYLKELYQIDGIADTTDFYHVKRHYYFSHTGINPTQVVPKGPDLDFSSPHQREMIG
ncbi:glutathione S-transferase family protein [Vibrio parahaemolyticus]|uniref:Putative glutathione S-transferase n=4 Tax=Vibrio parahaemolyticus TaxID=670 RepID=Q87MZ0_VIBPA|nr:glutathione S-transferase family protein [Vibrio parahaemolyticus]EFO38074.1 glutathione S-transferase, C-terminal domain protein [Vibrio parahaemolyticus Peru-466]EFO44089.1 glutathione S-transferase C-terminal domain protein [Vibrio parahaemolyticus AQ4037]EFO51485.1 glutathione S-transferase C-terminal domain protein [Vibrio parahaemolyticus K5030]ARC19568.1 glutathione S-transferase family protein [Vibrio parahaemolyticus]AZV70427.1 glutathione S-transferase family protein [Vibrio parah